MYIRLKKFINMFLVVCTMLVLTGNETIAYEVQAAESTEVVPRHAANISSQGYDIVLCIDNSESTWEYQSARDLAVRTMAHLAEGLDVRMGGLYFGDQVYKTQSLVLMEEPEGYQQIQNEFLNMTETDQNNQSTNLGAALEAAQTLFENQDTQRERIVVLFSDGIDEGHATDSAYIQNADKKTREQVELLEKNQIRLYCVHLQKNVSDGEYLKQAVNYFNDENKYDSVRYQMTADADQLSSLFAEIFYAIQNDMAYRSIEVDGDGTISFYVPEAGVEEIKIFLHNREDMQIYISNDSNQLDGYGSTIDYTNAFLTVTNPVTGNWTITVTGENVAETTGTIAYYTDLYAKIQFVSMEEDDEEVNRLDQVQLVVNFYDNAGNLVVLDENVEVTTVLSSMTEAGAKVSPFTVMSKADENCYGEPFVFENSGRYYTHVWVKYEDLLNLKYVGAPVIIYGDAPAMYQQESTLLSEQTETESGQTEELSTAAGSAKEEPVTAIKEFWLDHMVELGIGIGMVLFLILLISIYRSQKEKNRVKAIEKERKELLDWIRPLKEQCEKQNLWNQNVIASGYKDILKQIKTYYEIHLTEEQHKELGIETCLVDPEKRTEYQEWSAAAATVKEIGENLTNFQKFTKDISPQKAGASDMLKEYKKVLKNSGVHNLNSLCEQCKTAGTSMLETKEQASKVYKELKEILTTPIPCDLYIEWKNYIGGKKARLGKEKYLNGYYVLDNIMVSGPKGTMPLKDVYEDIRTGIFVSGYHGPEGEKGLLFKSEIPFDLKAEGDDGAQTCTKAVLFKGGRYYITLREYGRMSVRIM